MGVLEAEEFLRSRGICVCCHQNATCCPVGALHDVGRHEEYWRVNNVTARRPWWTAEELVEIILRNEARGPG